MGVLRVAKMENESKGCCDQSILILKDNDSFLESFTKILVKLKPYRELEGNWVFRASPENADFTI